MRTLAANHDPDLVRPDNGTKLRGDKIGVAGFIEGIEYEYRFLVSCRENARYVLRSDVKTVSKGKLHIRPRLAFEVHCEVHAIGNRTRRWRHRGEQFCERSVSSFARVTGSHQETQQRGFSAASVAGN